MLTPEVTGELDLRQPARQSGTLLHNRKLGEAGNRRRALRLGAELTRATVALGEPTERRASSGCWRSSDGRSTLDLMG
jgi:hypothetical protein